MPRVLENVFLRAAIPLFPAGYFFKQEIPFIPSWRDGTWAPFRTTAPRPGTAAESGPGFCIRVCSRRVSFRISRSRTSRQRWSPLCWCRGTGTVGVLKKDVIGEKLDSSNKEVYKIVIEIEKVGKRIINSRVDRFFISEFRILPIRKSFSIVYG